MRKIILIGLDGASWLVIDDLLRTGALPTIRSLIDKGMRSTLLNMDMVDKRDPWEFISVYREYKKRIPRLGRHSDINVWMNLLTGTTPDKHMVFDSLEEDSYGIKLQASGKARKKPAIWEILTRYDKSIGVVGWPSGKLSRKADCLVIPKINNAVRRGVEPPFRLNSRFSFCRRDFLDKALCPYPSWPDLAQVEYSREIESFIERIPYEHLSIFAPLLLSDSLYLEWTKYLLQKFPQPDFLAVCIYALHNLSHLFWDCLRVEEHKFKGAAHQRRRKKIGRIIEDYYRFIDRKIGEILSLADKDSVAIIVSVYGMGASRITKKYLLMDELYRHLNFLTYTRDKGIDWSRTSVYDDRNPWGIYAIRKGYIKGAFPARIFERLRKALEKITLSGNQPLFLKIDFNHKDNSFTVVPNYKAIHYSSYIYIKGRKFPVRQLVYFMPHYSLHSPEGILIISGRSVSLESKSNRVITSLDVLPTILSISGIKHSDPDMEGRAFVKARD